MVEGAPLHLTLQIPMAVKLTFRIIGSKQHEAGIAEVLDAFTGVEARWGIFGS